MDAFLNFSEASGVARNCVKLAESALSYELHVFSMFWNIGRSIPSRLESFLNFLINSSKELNLLEQRTLAQLLRAVLVVVDLLELWITGLYFVTYWTVLCLYLGCRINPFILVLHFKIKLFQMTFSIPIDSLGKHKVGNSKKTKS